MDMARKKILIDTDLGDDVDDAAALILALNSPELEIVGISTVYHNTAARAEMVLELCEKFGRTDIPVCAGCGVPLIERPEWEPEPVQYGVLSRRYPVQECDGPEFILRMVKKYPDLTIVAMGAMTNLGIACYREPEQMRTIPIIAMGGVFNSSALEWNIKCDPEAARLVMDYAGHLTMFGLEVTKYCRMEEALIDELCPLENEKLQYFKRGAEIFQKKTGYPYTFHDALLIAYLIDPTVVELEQSDFTVELSGINTRGAIVPRLNAYDINPACEKEYYFAKRIDVPKFQQIVRERFH